MMTVVTPNIFQRPARDWRQRFGQDKKKDITWVWTRPRPKAPKIIEAISIELRRHAIQNTTVPNNGMAM